MFTKPVSALTVADLAAVRGIAESERLEFKRDPYGRADEDVREMLRDMSSMANASGGYLLIGVDTDDEDRATDFPGIENAADEASRMLSSFRTAIEEQVLGLDFGVVEITAGRHVIIWSIPRSTRAPHLITFRGLNQFWRRHGRQKAKMTIEEIRDACLRVESIRKSLEEFLEDRRRSQLASVGADGVMLLSATPIVVRDEVLDTADVALRTLLRDPPMTRLDGFGVLHDQEPRPTLYGLRAEDEIERTELFRNGHLECSVALRLGRGPQTLNPFQLAETPLNFLLLANAIANHLGLQEPIVVKVALVGIVGWRLELAAFQVGTWTGEGELEVPAMQFPYPLNAGIAARHIANRLWNALRLENCQLFDNAGQFLPNYRFRNRF